MMPLEEETVVEGTIVWTRVKETNTYTLRDANGSFFQDVEFESDEEAIHYIIESFQTSVVNADPPKLGWMWKYVIAEGYVNYD